MVNSSTKNPLVSRLYNWKYSTYKVFALLTLFMAASTIAQAQCPVTGVLNNGSTSTNFRGLNPNFGRGCAVFLITQAELAAVGLTNGLSLTSVGGAFSTAPSLAATGTLQVYLQNTSDVTNTKSTTWLTAIGGMTQVHNASFTVPAALSWSTAISPFNYTGGGLYVAYEWTNCGTLATGSVVSCSNVNVGNVKSAQLSACTAITTIGGNSAFRPHTTFVAVVDDIIVRDVWTQGKSAVLLNNPQINGGAISNLFAASKSVSATITVKEKISGTVRYTNTQSITIPGCSIGTLADTGWSHTLMETDSVILSTAAVGGESNLANNSLGREQLVNINVDDHGLLNGVVQTSVGFNTGAGLLLSKYHVSGAAKVVKVRVRIGNGTGNTVFGVVCDINGTIVSQGPNYVIQAADLGNFVTFDIPPSPTFTNTYFYVGMGQTANTVTGYFPWACSNEVVRQPGNFYTSGITGGTPSELTTLAVRFWQEAELMTFEGTMNGTASICAGASANISAIITGGTSPYTLVYSDGSNSFTINNYVSGTNISVTPSATTTYSITSITDAASVHATHFGTPATITVNPNPTVNCTATDNTHCSPVNGSVTAVSSGVTYLWSNGATTASQNVAGGTYTVTVTNSFGCTATCSATMNDVLTFPTVVCTSTDNTNCTNFNGTATATATGVTYLWSNSQTSATATGLAAGTYTVIVTDVVTGCTATCSATISNNITLPTVTCASTDNSYCTGGNGTATASASNVSYAWTNGGTSATITGLIAGTYTVTVTDLTTGCTATCSSVISDSLTHPAPNCSATDNFNCVNPNGTVDATTPNVSYLWDNGTTTAGQIGLSPGTYTVTVTDLTTGCTGTCTAVVGDHTSPPTVSCSGTDNTDCLLPNGTVSATASNVSYLWSNGATSATQSGLQGTVYTVTVTDLNTSCTATCSVTILQPIPFAATCSGTNVSCNGGSDGTASATPIGGGAPYSYQWMNGDTSSSITGLSAGMYSVEITDANGCTATCVYTVTQPTALSLSCSGTNISCFGDNNGSASVSVSGGTPNYTYSWSNGSTDATISLLAAGTYTVIVTDFNGCSDSCQYTVLEPLALSANCSGTNVSCFGGTNGTASVAASGGTPIYNYLWSNGSTDVSITGLSAGDYDVLVTDANGCTAICSFTVTQPDQLTVTCNGSNVTCNGGFDGSISASVSGGTPGYTYLWGNNDTSSTLSGLGAGSYMVIVTDANGCTASCAYTVIEPGALLPNLSSTNITCNGANDGTATSAATGGTSPLSYLWSNGSTNSALANLAPGTYSVIVTDSVGCTAVDSVIITEPTLLTVNCSGTNVLCNGGVTGSAIVSASGGTPLYSYSWSNGKTSSTTGPVMAGTYTVLVTDANGCTATCEYIVTEPTALTLSLSSTNVTCAGGADGSITSTLGGGTPAYTYAWSNAGTNANLSGIMTGTYTLTVTDANGCTKTASVTIIALNAIPAQPGAITGPAVVCKGSTGNVYSIAAVPGATTYTWTVGAGATINSGQGSTSISVSFSNAATNGAVSVTATNVCGTSPARTKTYKAATTPGMPGTISGQVAGVCRLVNQSYSILPVPTATSYNWTVPAGVTIVSGQGTPAIVVTFTNAFTTQGNITVQPSNFCGNGPIKSLTVYAKPAQPVIIGANTACINQPGLVYSITPVPGASSYTWTVVPGSTLVSGQGTTSIVVNWGSINGQIKCKANNACGSSFTAIHGVSFTCREDGSAFEVSDINLFPNPTNNITTVKFDAFVDGNAEIAVIDLVGKVVMLNNIAVAEGSNTFTFDASTLAKGCYFVKVSCKGTSRVVRMTVQ